ncbi:MAG: hypothetical protein GF310_14415 [candidate division Zixibacteria bacterium]|nr:hypothetical protein [candidate division Zixibacteria bacterium]
MRLYKLFKLFAIIIIVMTVHLPAQGIQSTCIDCHGLLEDEMTAPVDSFENDVHNRPGLGCVGCHGGDNTSDDLVESMSPEKGFIGTPGPLEIPELCSKCHSDPDFMKTYNPSLPTDQYSKYLTSIHGKKSEEGDKKVAHCSSCHGAHGIRPSKNPLSAVYDKNIPATCAGCHNDSAYMAAYSIPTDQVRNYKQSVHGIALLEKGDLGAPTCNDCHGNHGAIPPDAESIDKVCGLCHHNNMVDFEKSSHADYFSLMEKPACESCHSNHLIEPPSTEMLSGEEPVCAQCHFEDDGTGALEAANMMADRIDSLEAVIASTEEQIEKADQKGLFVTDGLFALKDARQKVYKSRTAVHTFNADTVVEITAAGFNQAVEARTIAEELLDNYVFRRKGLAVSVVVLLILAFSIWIKVRRKESSQ